MTSTQRTERRGVENSQAEQQIHRVRQQVLRSLGTPPGWHEVQVRPLWDGRFRANVLVGESITSFTICHSFFLVTDDSGTVLESSPELVRRY
jgi:hypothetical protein